MRDKTPQARYAYGMYGKSFKSKYTGSLVGAGPVVFAVWDYMIAHAEDGTVDVNPALVAATIGKMTGEDVESAISFLAAPDPKSRSREENGARIVQVGPLQWRLVNWEFYRGLHRSESKRAQDRERQRRWRAEKQGATAKSVTKRDSALRAPKSQRDGGMKRKWTRAPEDWKPNDGHRALAAERQVAFDEELAKFRDHEFKSPKTDADAAFRTWLRNAGGYRSSPRQQAQGGVLDPIARAKRIREEFEAKQRGAQS